MLELQILKLQNFVDMPETIATKLFYLLPPPSSRSLILLLHERPTLLCQSSIFDSF